MTPTMSYLKARYSIAQAWRDLGLDGEPAKICRSPFPGEHKNGDAHPSFSVFADGGRFKDHATGAGGDVFDFVAKARSTDIAGAITWVRERLGVERAVTARTGGTPWPEMRIGTPDEIARLASLRDLVVPAVQLVSDRGFLQFGRLWGHAFWALTDKRRTIVEFRRLDGHPWPAFGRLAERKSHCLGSGKDWPIGTLEASPVSTATWMEGAPDFLAAWHYAYIEGKVDKVAPVAMLGAANHRVAPEALVHFSGKAVCLYPHVDEAGQKAAKAWAQQLRKAGATVRAYDLSGFLTEDGKPGKDLNDVCRMSPDCFEQAECYRFREVLP